LDIEEKSKEGILVETGAWNTKEMGVLMSEGNMLLTARFGFC